MGKRYTHLYMQSVLDGKSPRLWAAPPGNIVASDLVETMMNSIVAFGGIWLVTGGIQIITVGRFDSSSCLAWGGIAAGSVMLAPIVGDVLADLLNDIRQGWERGAVVESDPEPPVQMIAPAQTENGVGAAHQVEGEWWYRTESGRLCCYHIPRDKRNKPIISDARMRAIFGVVKDGTPFSEIKITSKISGLSGPRFRMLQDDWRTRSLYVIRPDRTGYFTATGKLIAKTIVDYLTPPV